MAYCATKEPTSLIAAAGLDDERFVAFAGLIGGCLALLGISGLLLAWRRASADSESAQLTAPATQERRARACQAFLMTSPDKSSWRSAAKEGRY